MLTHAIIVNYHAAALTLQAVASVRAQKSCGPVDITVVDNSTSRDEVEYLQNSLPPDIKLRINSTNLGFGAACNQVYADTHAPLILLLNPDARLLPGCLWRLQQTLLSSARCAAVGPRLYWDNTQTTLLPPSCPAAIFLLRPLADRIPECTRLPLLWRHAWRYYQIRHWTATAPAGVVNLSGGHALLRRRAVEKAGGLFDQRFFMYFEDTDLFLRLKRAGYRLVVDSRARAIHHYDHCGADRHYKQQLMQESQVLFQRKYQPAWLARLERRTAALNSCGFEPATAPQVFSGPFSLAVPRHLRRHWLFEWSPNADFIPSAGRFGHGPTLTFTRDQWALLPPGLYHGRLGHPGLLSGRILHASWIKS